MAGSRIALEATEVSEDAWTEAGVFIERDGDPDQEMGLQVLLMTPAELSALFAAMKTYYEQGIWSIRTVEA